MSSSDLTADPPPTLDESIMNMKIVLLRLRLLCTETRINLFSGFVGNR